MTIKWIVGIIMLINYKGVFNMEKWKDIEGYEGYYQVSDLGNIRSLERTYIDSIGRNVKRKSRFINKELGSGGYQRAKLNKENIAKKFLVHRLVAKAFLENIENKPCVNHKNGNKEDNRKVNLEWVTYKENAVNALENELWKSRKKIKFYNDTEEIFFKSLGEASSYFGYESAYVSHAIKLGKKEIKGYKFEFLQ